MHRSTRHTHVQQSDRDHRGLASRSRHSLRRQLLAAPVAALVATAIAVPMAAATTAPPQSAPAGSAPGTAQGIIMRDGGVCDPIRHMGC